PCLSNPVFLTLYLPVSLCASPCLSNPVSPCLSLCSGEEECPTWGSYVGKMFSAASSYLPAQVSGVMSQERAFATVRLLVAGQRNVCTLAM
uniref:Uncharacterized protein n=1 Tax=Hucho hucho TaxID=62062 RepID=A0A4W5RNM5_9TELE